MIPRDFQLDPGEGQPGPCRLHAARRRRHHPRAHPGARARRRSAPGVKRGGTVNIVDPHDLGARARRPDSRDHRRRRHRPRHQPLEAPERDHVAAERARCWAAPNDAGHHRAAVRLRGRNEGRRRSRCRAAAAAAAAAAGALRRRRRPVRRRDACGSGRRAAPASGSRKRRRRSKAILIAVAGLHRRAAGSHGASPCCSSSGSAIRAPSYAGNRHNIGFMAVEAIASRHGFAPWRRRFQGVAAEGTHRRRARAAAAARHLHERVRAARSARPRLLQADARPTSSCSMTRSICRRQVAGEGRRRLPGITGCARSARISATTIAACGSASVIPASRNWCMRHVLSDFAKSRARLGRGACATSIADNAELLAQGQGRELPEQGASRDGPRASARKRRRSRPTPTRIAGSWVSNAASSDCRMSASRRCSMR